MQVLYQCDMRELDPDQAIAAFYGSLYSEENEEQPENDSFMEALVRGSMQKKARDRRAHFEVLGALAYRAHACCGSEYSAAGDLRNNAG